MNRKLISAARIPRVGWVRALTALTLAALLGMVTACGGAGGSASEDGLTKVRVGGTFGDSDAGFFIAHARGYFEEEGLDVELVQFKSASDMIAPLAAGEIQVAGGAPSAGLYNALARDLKLKIVADKGTNVPGSGYFSLLVRKDLVDSGQFKGFKDLQGMKIGFTGAGNTTQALVADALADVGIDYADADIQEELIGFGEQAAALESGSIDAGTVIEPFASKAVESGAAVAYPGDEFYPNQQVAVVMYGEQFINEEPEAAQGFMNAYMKAARDYNDALVDGRFSDTKAADDIIDILVEYTAEKDPEVHRSSGPAGLHPDVALGLESMQQDLEFWESQGLIEADITVDDAVDTSFYEKAREELGPYQPAGK